jgi:hypothetical protein
MNSGKKAAYLIAFRKQGEKARRRPETKCTFIGTSQYLLPPTRL